MNRLDLTERLTRYTFAAGSIALVAVSMAAAQSTNNTIKKPVVPAKPAVVKATAPTAASAIKSASSQTAMPVTNTQATSSSSPMSAPTNYMTGQGTSSQQLVNGSQSGGSRSALTTQGLGTFLWGDGVLTVYGCYRTGTRVLCDFDFTKQNNAQVNAPWVWGGVNMVDDGGKVTAIHTGFFMGQDGSQFPTAYVTTNPVRMIMEYDNVASNFNSVALVFGSNRIQGVPITLADPNQPAGTIPGRGTTATQGTGTTAGTNPIDGATNAVNNATNTVNGTAQKSKSLWDSLKSATSK
jgi:hypothetical protein